MQPTREPDINTEFFLAAAQAFFADNGLVAYTDPSEALQFILAVDEIVELYTARLAADEMALPDELVVQIGSALGEAFIMVFGGVWEYVASASRWQVGLVLPSNDSISINVFHKVEKRFENGEEDSISYLFEMIRKVYLEEMDLFPEEPIQ